MCSPARVWPGPTPCVTPIFRRPFDGPTVYISPRNHLPRSVLPRRLRFLVRRRKPPLGDLLINHSPVIAIDERLRRASLSALSAHGGIRQISRRLYRRIIDRALLDRSASTAAAQLTRLASLCCAGEKSRRICVSAFIVPHPPRAEGISQRESLFSYRAVYRQFDFRARRLNQQAEAC